MKKTTIIAFFAIWAITCHAQEKDSVSIFTADSLKSGSYKDVFTSFFQLAVNNLTGQDKELRFMSNPFAIMAKGNKALLVDTNYIKYRHLRDLNFDADVKLDTNYHLSGFKGGIKYALINARDVTVSKKFIKDIINSDQGKEWQQFIHESVRLVSAIPDDKLRSKVRKQLNRLIAQDDTTFTYAQMDDDVKTVLNKYIDSLHLNTLKLRFENYPDVNVNQALSVNFNQMRADFLNKPLWTIGGDIATGSNKLYVSNAVFNSEFLVGISSKNKTTSMELDLKALFSMNDDTLKAGNDLQRTIGSFEPGVNFAFRTKDENKSFLEFKVSKAYYHIFSGPNPFEKQDSSTINAELRLRVYDDIWIPITVKYDLEHGNVFGFLNVKANFTGLANLLKK